jgi:mRNA interferase YafQ
MRTIKYTTQFKRDYKREKKGGRHSKVIDKELLKVTRWLALDKRLAKRYCDHALAADWKDHRACHIKPDLILIYRKPNDTALELVRLGSHSQLGL